MLDVATEESSGIYKKPMALLKIAIQFNYTIPFGTKYFPIIMSEFFIKSHVKKQEILFHILLAEQLYYRST
jgi:hypothetical protein